MVIVFPREKSPVLQEKGAAGEFSDASAPTGRGTTARKMVLMVSY